MKIRQGRHNKRIVYIQHGDEPTDNDEMLAVFFDGARAAIVVDVMNAQHEDDAWWAGGMAP